MPESDFGDLFADWMVDTVQVEPSAGRGWDADAFGAAVPVPRVMVTEQTGIVRDANGVLVESAATLMLADDPTDQFHPGDRVTLPSGRKLKVVQVTQAAPRKLFDHWTVTCG